MRSGWDVTWAAAALVDEGGSDDGPGAAGKHGCRARRPEDGGGAGGRGRGEGDGAGAGAYATMSLDCTEMSKGR